jgi:hypothetical protein
MGPLDAAPRVARALFAFDPSFVAGTFQATAAITHEFMISDE